jgi:hypothetical protein
VIFKFDLLPQINPNTLTTHNPKRHVAARTQRSHAIHLFAKQQPDMARPYFTGQGRCANKYPTRAPIRLPAKLMS